MIVADKMHLSDVLVTSRKKLRAEVSQLVGHNEVTQSQGSLLYNPQGML